MTDKKHVYILCTYDEHGIKDYHATLDRSLLEFMLVKHWPARVNTMTIVKINENNHINGWGVPMPDGTTALFEKREQAEKYIESLISFRQRGLVELKKLLLESDEDLVSDQGYALEVGWGGIQLYVIELATSQTMG